VLDDNGVHLSICSSHRSQASAIQFSAFDLLIYRGRKAAPTSALRIKFLDRLSGYDICPFVKSHPIIDNRSGLWRPIEKRRPFLRGRR
jgi:hypothetical protein